MTAIVTAVVVLPVVFLMVEVVVPSSLHGWAVVIGIVLICEVFGQGLITWALAHIKASLALLMWGETLGALQLLGCAFVLAGIVMARCSSR